jgi:hypothetical protein
MDADWADEVRAMLGAERIKSNPDPARIAQLEQSYRKAQNRADASDFEAHRFDDERG